MTIVDLSNCDREPIHIPGKIQSHGFLMAISRELTITYCSQNIVDFTGISAGTLLGESISLLERSVFEDKVGFIEKLVHIAQTKDGFQPVNPYPVTIGNKDFNLILCSSADQYLLEFELAISDLGPDLQQVIGGTLSEILADANLSLLLDKTAMQIQKLINYDRVMVYKFHEDGHGEVVAEAKNNDLEPWVGLHYPASDIPKQARELYKLNLVRLIADVETVPSAIVTFEELNQVPLDLTHSSLRAVSPIHIQYLKNMGVASSFSVSLLHQGELWGLVACHNYTPRYINYKQREASKLVGQVLSSALSFRQQEEDQQKGNRLKGAVDDLSRHLLRYNNIEDALFKHDVTLLHAVDAGGAVLAYDNHFYHTGSTPDDAFIKELIDWLQENVNEAIYATNSLPEEYSPAIAHKATASGILACRLSRELREYVIWFRPEVATIVNWAGNPDKPVEFTETGMSNISPRKSFETWTQMVQLTSAPWTSEDFRSALQLKEEVAFFISRKATEIRILNDKLKEAYDELDAFSYTISHDLKNPLTTIKSYSQLLKRSLILAPREQSMLEGILNGANRMQAMIEEVLHYSKAGQIKTKPRFVDMEDLLADLKEQLLVAHEDLPLTIDIGAAPPIYGDETMIQQVFSNLIGNAIKYSSKTGAPRVIISGELVDDQVRYRVTDNGIGIKLNDIEKIFDLFTQIPPIQHFFFVRIKVFCTGAQQGYAVLLYIISQSFGKPGEFFIMLTDAYVEDIFFRQI
ncbi:MAG: GAF domain-containing protein [Sphingobacteriaceae bacterium]|nr:MAG: GAF domain-containing protein [Sphingobacteriaceae bacterium]